MVLVRRRDDGTVWVVSRLLRSSSGEAGVKNHSRVISVDGLPMRFPSEEVFATWSKKHRPRFGKEEVWVFENITAHLKPSLVTTKIPVYWSPNQQQVTTEKNAFVQHNLFFCKKTCQYVICSRVSNEALRQVFM
jgi:hypothetical protein